MPHRSPQHYRNRASELRAEAAGRAEAITRDILIHVAEQCEQMAAEIEARAEKSETRPPSGQNGPVDHSEGPTPRA